MSEQGKIDQVKSSNMAVGMVGDRMTFIALHIKKSFDWNHYCIATIQLWRLE